MVLFFFFTHMVAHRATMCVKKDGFFRPAGGEPGRVFRQSPDLEPTA